MIPARRLRFSPCWHDDVLQGLWNIEVVDWGRRGPSEWVSLRALCVPKSAAVETVLKNLRKICFLGEGETLHRLEAAYKGTGA